MTTTATPGERTGLPEVELFDQWFKDDPLPSFRRWLARPPFWARVRGEVVVVAARFRDVQDVYADHRRFSSVKPPASGADAMNYFSGTADMAFSDEPVHSRLRSVLQPAFTPSVVAGFEAAVGEVVDELLDAVDRGPGSFELMAQLARPLAARSLLGVVLHTPPEDFGVFQRFAAAVPLLMAAPPGETPQEYQESYDAVREHCDRTVAQRRAEPHDDPMGRVVQANAAGTVTGEEVFGLIKTLYLGGLSTVATQVGLTVAELVERPAQWASLCADRSLVPGAVEEGLRWGPAGLFNYRFAATDVEWAGLQIPARTMVYIVHAATGFDPDAFEEPFEFRVDRPPARNLGLGFGIHACIGAPVARLVVRRAVEGLAARYPALRRDLDAPPTRYGGMAQERAPDAVHLLTA